MEYDHSFEKANDIASKALERLHKEKLPPSPDLFEVWYSYYGKSMPEITRAVDILQANKQRLDETRCRELYRRFLSEASEQERVRRAGDQVNSALKNVSGVVKGVSDATSKYSGTLNDVNSKLQKADSPEELKNILSDVMQGTESMLSYNQNLEQQLNESAALMEELQRDLENVRREALTDGLTGLANRKAFDSEIRRICREAEAEGTAFALIMMDIDHFKPFNDNYGHQVGDQVLRLVSKTLIEGVKGRDVAARYGGEEFAIILPQTNLQAGIAVANNLRKAVATKEIVNRNTGDKLGEITLSAGVAQNIKGESIRDLIERADSALYTAKHNGRNQVAAAPVPGST